MYDDPKRYENDGLYEDEDTEYEDEYEADDSDYIVDDEDEDENALWDDAEEDADDPPEKKRRKRKKKDIFADSDTDAEDAEAEEYEKTRRRLAKEQRIIDEIEADAAENPIEDDSDDTGDEQSERKLLKRELRAQALKRLEDSARTLKDYENLVAWYDRLDANRQRRERYHELFRNGDDVPLDYGASEDALCFPDTLNDVLKWQDRKGDFIDAIFYCPYDIHELVTDADISIILDILRKYSDEDHRLSQKDIAEILKTEYDMTADRKAIRRNILNLMDCGYNIEYSESIRMVPNPKTGEPEESYLWSDFYLEREFTDGELRLLIDSLLFSKHIPYSQCKALVDKLEGLSNVYFRSRVKHIARLPEDKTDNKQLFLTIELLDEAISRGRKVSFKYLEYGTDKRPHIKTRPDGTERVYIISPYQMAAKEGKYYLICNYDKYDDISNYRLDRITELKIMDEPAKPFDTLIWTNGRTLDLATYMKEHPYMYSSDNIRAVFRVAKAMVSDVIDLFGTEVTFSNEDDTGVTVSAFTNEMAMEQFAMNFAPDVSVLEPTRLREKVKNALEKALEKYK